MSKKSILLHGTFVLTSVGLITRIMGFIYRIFLSNTFGEENVGLYQLIFPIYALCFSFTSAGIQVAISRNVARKVASGKSNGAKGLAICALSISLVLSLFVMLLLQFHANYLAKNILFDPRSAPLLVVISYALPFASIHSCICGYYLGLKQTKVTAYSQLIEQIVRISSVILLWYIGTRTTHFTSIQLAVLGVVFGEIASALYCIICFSSSKRPSLYHTIFYNLKLYFRDIYSLALPLTANRVSLNILQSAEAISIPLQLQIYGFTSSEALKIYGVLTGIVLPCILFPSAITNSVSTMLLPTVADIQVRGKVAQLKELIGKVSGACALLGFACLVAFLLFGRWLGIHIFNSPLAGDFLMVLAWLCPFLYLNNTLISIINGLGKATLTFIINVISLIIRILGIWLGIPKFGINGYLYGLLISQIFTTFCCSIMLAKKQNKNEGE